MFALNLCLLLFRLSSVLVILFSFEFITMKMFLMMVYMLAPFDSSSVLMFMAVVACEAAFGLSLMMTMLRQMGLDNVKTKSSLLSEGVN